VKRVKPIASSALSRSTGRRHDDNSITCHYTQQYSTRFVCVLSTAHHITIAVSLVSVDRCITSTQEYE